MELECWNFLPRYKPKENPYDELWTKDRKNELFDLLERQEMYQDYIVCIEIDGSTINEILQYDGNEGIFVWESDWWEGEKNVFLIGFQAVDDIDIPAIGGSENDS